MNAFAVDFPQIVTAVVFIAAAGALELGTAAARRLHRTESTGRGGAVPGAVLALVGLLFAFMFSFAASRYDLRRHLMVQEANAIGTAYLRAGLVPGAPRDAARALLRRYADERIAFFRARGEEAERTRALADAARTGRALWALAEHVAAVEPQAARSGLFVQSVGVALDVEAQQNDALTDRLPAPILGVLIVAVCISGGVIGLAHGGGERRRLYGLAYAVLMSAVAFAIADLDQGEVGSIRAEIGPLVAMRAQLR